MLCLDPTCATHHKNASHLVLLGRYWNVLLVITETIYIINAVDHGQEKFDDRCVFNKEKDCYELIRPTKGYIDEDLFFIPLNDQEVQYKIKMNEDAIKKLKAA